MTQMTKQLIMRSFNQQIYDFGRDTMIIFPDNNDIKVAFTNLELLKKANPSVALKAWHNRVYQPYKSEIDNCNIDFFLEKDYTEDMMSVGKGQKTIHVIDNVRRACIDLDEANKKHIMDYVVVLSKLSIAYMNM